MIQNTAANIYIAPHLQLREVACGCIACGGQVAPMNVLLLTAWAHWRERRGSAIHIESGYRCPKHNRAVGGSKNSRHLFGMALDISKVEGSNRALGFMDPDLLGELMACGFNGIGRSKTQLHVDVRDRAYFWRYLDDGKRMHDADARKAFTERTEQ